MTIEKAIERAAQALNTYSVSPILVDGNTSAARYVHVVWRGDFMRRADAAFESGNEGEARAKCRELNARSAIAAFLREAEATEDAKLLGARSIRDTMGAQNFIDRSSRCWRAMSARMADEVAGGTR